MTRVNHTELDFADDLLCLWHGEPFTGVACEYASNMALVSEVTYVDGMQTGMTREWYPSGQLKMECEYLNGSKHGILREWFESGHLEAEASYEFSILTRKRTWDREGHLVGGFEISSKDPQYSLLLTLRQGQARQQR